MSTDNLKDVHVGLSKGVLFVHGHNTTTQGVPWPGLISIKEQPGGADMNNLWLHNIEYAQLSAPHTFSATIEAYTYPQLFNLCLGYQEVGGVGLFSNQKKHRFSLFYRTEILNADGHQGYLLTWLYNLIITPSERYNKTNTDSPEAVTFSWKVDSLPVRVASSPNPNRPAVLRPVSKITMDSRKNEYLAYLLEDAFYNLRLFLTPDELYMIFISQGPKPPGEPPEPPEPPEPMDPDLLLGVDLEGSDNTPPNGFSIFGEDFVVGVNHVDIPVSQRSVVETIYVDLDSEENQPPVGFNVNDQDFVLGVNYVDIPVSLKSVSYILSVNQSGDNQPPLGWTIQGGPFFTGDDYVVIPIGAN